MAKVSLRLECRKESKSGVYPVVIVIRAGGSVSQITTNVSVKPEQWDGESVVKHPQKKMLNDMLSFRLNQTNIILSEWASNGKLRGMSAKEIKDALIEATTGKKKIVKGSFAVFFEKFVERKEKRNTRNAYHDTYVRLSRFADVDALAFEDIDVAFLRDFDTDCAKRGLAVNTRVFDMRNIRAVFNAAIDEGIITPNTYPFRRYKIRAEKTRKRSLSVEELVMLMNHECEAHETKYRDIFMLSFFLAGMNMVDLLNYPAQAKLDKIAYSRAKTGIFVEFDIPKQAKEIIEKYRGTKLLINVCEEYTYYKDFLHRMNENLQKIGFTSVGKQGKKTFHPLFPDLTSYWARHTWATIAADMDIPDATIDIALAHKPIFAMSDIYIRRNMKKASEALQRVADAITEAAEEAKKKGTR